jgi:molybdopterin synthase catalytic subunit
LAWLYFLDMIDLLLTNSKLDIANCQAWAASDSNGAIVSFVGTVRNHTKGKQVLYLTFEAYEKMAVSEMRKIAEKALATFQIKNILIHHRTGQLAIGEVPVIIVVGASHRGAAFEACQYAIDTLKETVPIWKKEHFEDGDVWVSATP